MLHLYKYILTLTLLLSYSNQSIDAINWSWDCYWVNCHPSIENSQIWFRKTFVLPQGSVNATAEVASNGFFELFINGRNVSTKILAPYKNLRNDTVRFIDYDISRFLHNDTNTVAVWYSPDTYRNSYKLSVQIYGTSTNDEQFSIHTDTTWLYHEANTINEPNGDEIIDANAYNNGWKSNDCCILDWRYTTNSENDVPFNREYLFWKYQAFSIEKIVTQLNVIEKNDTIWYDFGRNTTVWVRLTFRGMRRGSVITVNGLKYICQGVDDEQACRRFSVCDAGYAIVTVPKGFSKENITKAESITIGLE